MKRIHVIGLAAVAALLVTVVGASAAFGFSEWLAAGGASPKGITFAGKGGKAAFLSAGGNKIECEKSESTGEFKGVLEASALVKCTGNSKISGTLNGTCVEPIETQALIALPGTITGAASGRGVLLLPAVGAVMAKVTCAGIAITVEGGLVCESEPVQKLSLSGKVICREASAGVQQFTEIDVGGALVKDELIANAIFTKEKCAQEATENLTFSKEVEQT
jgi:hypothetical protein